MTSRPGDTISGTQLVARLGVLAIAGAGFSLDWLGFQLVRGHHMSAGLLCELGGLLLMALWLCVGVRYGLRDDEVERLPAAVRRLRRS